MESYQSVGIVIGIIGIVLGPLGSLAYGWLSGFGDSLIANDECDHTVKFNTGCNGKE
jgi:hypothetical protein